MSLRGPRRSRSLVVGVLALLLALQGCGGPPEAHVEDPVPRDGTLAVIGDSFMAGRDPAEPDPGLAEHLAEDLKAELVNFAVSGTGYLHRDADGEGRYLTQAREAVDSGADGVVVYGAAADWLDIYGTKTKKLSDLAQAARTVFDLLVDAFGRSNVVVIGPVWAGQPVPESARDLRDVLRREAEKARLPFVDPIDERWLTSENSAEMMAADGVTPSPAGQRYFASKMADAVIEIAAARE